MDLKKQTQNNLLFIFDFSNANEKINFYSQGHISIIFREQIFTTSKTSQQMTIFLSLGDLLDGIIHFFKTNSRSFEFYSDSNFSFKLKKISENKIQLFTQERRKIDNLHPEEIIHGIWNGVVEFEKRVSNVINNDVETFSDIIYMLKKYKEEFYF